MKIVLGSKSARRKELLSLMGYDFIVHGVDTNEEIDGYKNSKDYVYQVVLRKGGIVSELHPNDLVICADTIVVVDDNILNKPHNINEAREMIKILAGRSHDVLTAVYLNYRNKNQIFIEKTKVVIDELSEAEIEEYVNTNEPYDKAGGYAIQGLFAKHIKSIKGDYYNVMGLPINKLYHKINEISK